jgi:hypothetical protein
MNPGWSVISFSTGQPGFPSSVYTKKESNERKHHNRALLPA